MVLYQINGICSVRSLGHPRNANFIKRLLIPLIWYNPLVYMGCKKVVKWLLQGLKDNK